MDHESYREIIPEFTLKQILKVIDVFGNKPIKFTTMLKERTIMEIEKAFERNEKFKPIAKHFHRSEKTIRRYFDIFYHLTPKKRRKKK